MTPSSTTPIAAGRVTSDDIARVLRPLVPGTHSALLFGSRATLQASASSDWDIGVFGPASVDGAILERMREALEQLPTLRTFDVVDLWTAPAELRERALAEGVALA